MTDPTDVGRVMYEAIRIAGVASLVAGLWWIRCLHRSPAHTLVAQGTLTDHLHHGRTRFERSLRAFGCAPFEDGASGRARARPALRLVQGGASSGASGGRP